MNPYKCESCGKETKIFVNVGDHIFCEDCIEKAYVKIKGAAEHENN